MPNVDITISGEPYPKKEILNCYRVLLVVHLCNHLSLLALLLANLVSQHLRQLFLFPQLSLQLLDRKLLPIATPR